MLAVPAGIGPGADRLGLQGCQGPVPTHLIGDHALDIVFKVRHIHHLHAAAGEGVLKAAGVPVALEPGHRLLSKAQRHDAQRVPVGFVQDLIGAGDGHLDRSPAGGRHGDGPLAGLLQRHESAALVKIAEGIALPHRVFQVGGVQDRGAVPETHFDDAVFHRGGGSGAEHKKCHNQTGNHHPFFHRTSQYPRS